MYTAYYVVSEDEEIVGDKEIEIPGMEHHVDVQRTAGRVVDMTSKSEYVETKGLNPADRAEWIIRRISELSGYESINDSVKADIFGFDISDVSGSIRLFSDVMKKLGISWMVMSFMESFREFMMRV